jgi:hypothetical protein
MPPDPRRLPQSLSWLTWSTIGLGTKGVAQFTVLAVLARFLDAQEFGVVSATLIVIGLGRAISFSSIGPALVQRPELREAHVRSAFALGMYTAAGLVALLWLAAAPTASFFGMQALGLEDVMHALTLVVLFEALGVVPEALLQRAASSCFDWAICCESCSRLVASTLLSTSWICVFVRSTSSSVNLFWYFFHSRL